MNFEFMDIDPLGGPLKVKNGRHLQKSFEVDKLCTKIFKLKLREKYQSLAKMFWTKILFIITWLGPI